MTFSVDVYNRIESAIHPNISNKIHKFKQGNYYVFPTFHGCNFKNRNGSRKRINYKVGNMCVSPTENIYWKDIANINKKKLPYKIYFTRYGYLNYGINSFITRKNGKWFDCDKKRYFDKSKWNDKEEKGIF